MNKIDSIGLQLYTIRTEMERNFEGALEKVAAVGYKEVEFAGYFDHTPQDVRKRLAACGLTAPSAHVDYESLESRWSQVVETAQTIGHGYLVIAGIGLDLPGEPDIWRRAAEVLNRAGELSKRAGIQLAYHNHHLEFLPVNGKKPYHLLLELCDPDLVKMEIDFCWIAAVEQDPFVYLQRYPGRFPLAHLKQLRKLPTRTPGDEAGIVLLANATSDLTEVGEGVIDWKFTLAQAMQSGTQHFFVEHDAPPSPFESIQTSYDYLEKLRF